MGKFYYTTQRDMKAHTEFTSGNVDSCLGDRAKSVGTFREYVVYDRDQLYPEYIVLLSRVHAADDEKRLRALGNNPFHMQLPVYWKNAARNPVDDPFDEQYEARKSTVQLIQRLASAATKKKGLKVLDVQRIEDSKTWIAYVNFQRELRQRLSKDDAEDEFHPEPCTPVNLLDGKADFGHVWSHQVMGGFAVEDVISLHNLATSLNEMLLWHGTNEEAARSITTTGFRIPTGDDGVAHGTRFGLGAYLAENLDKSLDYSPKDGKGEHWILLCRCTCGEFHYTEKSSEADAHTNAIQNGKDSVLANPGGNGPREFIVLQAKQVYPEFVLKVRY